MKTIEELKKVWLGIVIAYVSMIVLAAAYNGDLSVFEIINEYVLTEAGWLSLCGMIITITATWLIRIMYKAITNEIIDIKENVKGGIVQAK